jgi:hypothetical protein
MSISERERDVIIHALGLTRRGSSKGQFGRRWAYRNYFDAGRGYALTWDALVERGLAKRHMGNSGAVYTVTAAGMAAAGATYYVPREMRNAAK